MNPVAPGLFIVKTSERPGRENGEMIYCPQILARFLVESNILENEIML